MDLEGIYIGKQHKLQLQNEILGGEKKDLKNKKKMSDPIAAFAACQNSIQPKTPEQIIADKSPSISSMLSALKLPVCTTVDAEYGVLPLVKFAQVDVSVGCQQIAVMGTTVDTTQRVLQCAINSVSQTTSTSVMNSNNITVVLTGHAHIDCLTVEQNIQARVASYGDFGAVIQQKFGVTINDMVNSMATTVQDSSKSITSPQGQQDVKLFVNELEQTANSSTYNSIVQEAINNFQSSNNFELELTDYAFIGAAYPNAVTQCVTVTQTIMMQVLVQNIMTNCLANVFSTDLAAAFTQTWVTSQKSVTTTEPLLNLANLLVGGFFMFILIGALAVGIFMITKNGGNNSVMSSSTGQPGSRGKIIAIVMIVLGIILFITGLALLFTGTVVGGAIALIVGAVMIGFGAYLFYRAKKASEASTNPSVVG